MKIIERTVKSVGAPDRNDLWIDENHLQMKVFDNGEWKELSGGTQSSFGFAEGITFNAHTDRDTYIQLVSPDNSASITHINKHPSEHGNDLDIIEIGVSAPFVKQKVSTINQEVPLIMAAKRKQLMTDNTVDVVYFNKDVTINPSTGTITAKEVVVNGVQVYQSLVAIQEALQQIKTALNLP